MADYLRGCGYTPYFVEGDDPPTVHQLTAATFDHVFDEIRGYQRRAREEGIVERPRWPMIVLVTPKGWTGPKMVDGKQVDQFDVQHIDFTTAPRTPGSVLNGKSSGIIGGFSVFGFGFHSWGASKAFDLYYDDIVIDTKRVNCLK